MARLPHIEGVGATAAPGAIVVFDWTATAERRPSSSLVEPIRRIDELSLRKTLVWPYFLEGCPRILRLSAGTRLRAAPSDIYSREAMVAECPLGARATASAFVRVHIDTKKSG